VKQEEEIGREEGTESERQRKELAEEGGENGKGEGEREEGQEGKHTAVHMW